MKLFRGLLNATAIMLIGIWITAAFLGYRWGYLLVAAACLFLMTGYGAFCDQLRADHERRRESHDAMRLAATNEHTRVRDDILRRDPLAYPLTKRAVWPADEWSGQ